MFLLRMQFQFVEKYRLCCLLLVFLLSLFPIPFGNVFHKKGSTETDECDTDTETESTESTGKTPHGDTKNVSIVYRTCWIHNKPCKIYSTSAELGRNH